MVGVLVRVLVKVVRPLYHCLLLTGLLSLSSSLPPPLRPGFFLVAAGISVSPHCKMLCCACCVVHSQEEEREGLKGWRVGVGFTHHKG